MFALFLSVEEQELVAHATNQAYTNIVASATIRKITTILLNRGGMFMIENRNSIPRWVSLIYRYGQMYIGEHLKKYDIGRGAAHFYQRAV